MTLLDCSDPDVLAACESRDMPVLFGHLQRSGVRQRRIGALTGLAQSEVCCIVGGRTVVNYDRLVRIATGLGIPRGFMGLAHDRADPTPEEAARASAVWPMLGMLDDPDVVAACAVRDIASVYRYLQGCGISQRRLAELTGQEQGDVSAVLTGRRVPRAYDLFARIAAGLGIPRGRMGLATRRGDPWVQVDWTGDAATSADRQTPWLDHSDPDVVAACAARDVPKLFRYAQAAGLTQRQIEAFTGVKNPEVCLIVAGKQVTGYDRLVRVADGLGIPRGLMGLAHDQADAAVNGAAWPTPGLLDDPDLVAACARRDVTALFRYLQGSGVRQWRIAAATGLRQADVSSIANGRRAPRHYHLLVRIADGLGIPRGRMGLAYVEEPATTAPHPPPGGSGVQPHGSDRTLGRGRPAAPQADPLQRSARGASP